MSSSTSTSSSDPPSQASAFATAHTHADPPLQTPTSTLSTAPSPILTTYLPLLGLVTAPILLLLPPRKLDLYTLSLFGVFGLSAEEYWYGAYAQRGHRRREGMGAEGRYSGTSVDDSGGGVLAGRGGMKEGGAVRLEAREGKGGSRGDGEWDRQQREFWRHTQPSSSFRLGRLDEMGGSTPIRGRLGLGHDGRRLLLRQSTTAPMSSSASSSRTDEGQKPAQPLFQLPSSKRESYLFSSGTENGAASLIDPPSGSSPTERFATPTGGASSSSAQNGLELSERRNADNTSRNSDSSKDGDDAGGVSGMLRRLYYGDEKPAGWAERRAEEERERIQRGEGVLESIAETVGEAFGGKKEGGGA